MCSLLLPKFGRLPLVDLLGEEGDVLLNLGNLSSNRAALPLPEGLERRYLLPGLGGHVGVLSLLRAGLDHHESGFTDGDATPCRDALARIDLGSKLRDFAVIQPGEVVAEVVFDDLEFRPEDLGLLTGLLVGDMVTTTAPTDDIAMAGALVAVQGEPALEDLLTVEAALAGTGGVLGSRLGGRLETVLLGTALASNLGLVRGDHHSIGASKAPGPAGSHTLAPLLAVHRVVRRRHV